MGNFCVTQSARALSSSVECKITPTNKLTSRCQHTRLQSHGSL